MIVPPTTIRKRSLPRTRNSLRQCCCLQLCRCTMRLCCGMTAALLSVALTEGGQGQIGGPPWREQPSKLNKKQPLLTLRLRPLIYQEQGHARPLGSLLTQRQICQQLPEDPKEWRWKSKLSHSTGHGPSRRGRQLPARLTRPGGSWRLGRFQDSTELRPSGKTKRFAVSEGLKEPKTKEYL